MLKEYAIIDVETTGYGVSGNRITDIAIFIHNGVKIIDEYQTFVNPEAYIPENITRLTRITNEMVAHAPKFYEIARKVFEMTENRVFVAHNVNFDYGVVKNEFAQLGGTYHRETLCTIKLSRQLLPNYDSYSLGSLCADLNIENNDRHRALGDARATVDLFEMLIAKSKENGYGELTGVKAQRKINLPPLLDRKIYDDLPETYGVYYFKNIQGEIIYVGKANNIKQRVASHFNDKRRKEQQMFELTADIDFMETGNELVALLLESNEIKRLWPQFNHSQKKTVETHGLFRYEDGESIIRLEIGRIKNGLSPLLGFYNVQQAKGLLESLVRDFTLCPKCCGLEKTKSACFASTIKKCKGVCSGNESIVEYNQRVEEAISTLFIPQKDFFILEDSKDVDEIAIISIKNGVYSGFGYCDLNKISEGTPTIDSDVIKYPDTRDTQRIVRLYLKNNSDARILES